jgi:hypothetical protein
MLEEIENPNLVELEFHQDEKSMFFKDKTSNKIRKYLIIKYQKLLSENRLLYEALFKLEKSALNKIYDQNKRFLLDDSYLGRKLNSKGLQLLFADFTNGEIQYNNLNSDALTHVFRMAEILNIPGRNMGKFISKDQYERFKNKNLLIDEIMIQGLDILKKFYNMIAPLGLETKGLMESAAKYGDIDCMEWLLEKGFEIKESVIDKAVEFDQENVLDWALIVDRRINRYPTIGNDNPAHFWIYKSSCRHGKISIFCRYYHNSECAELFLQIAAAYGQMEMLKYLFTIAPELINATKLFCAAIDSDKVEIMELLFREMGIIFDVEKFLTRVVKNEKIEMLKWLSGKIDITSIENLCEVVSSYGSLNVLKYLVEHNFHLTNACFENAIKYGHVNILEYLRDNNLLYFSQQAEFLEVLCRRFLSRFNEKIFRWFLSKDICKVDLNLIDKIFSIKKYEFLDIIKDKIHDADRLCNNFITFKKFEELEWLVDNFSSEIDKNSKIVLIGMWTGSDSSSKNRMIDIINRK